MQYKLFFTIIKYIRLSKTPKNRKNSRNMQKYFLFIHVKKYIIINKSLIYLLYNFNLMKYSDENIDFSIAHKQLWAQKKYTIYLHNIKTTFSVLV